MKLFLTLPLRIAGFVVTLTVLAAALNVIIGTPAPISAKREYIGKESLTVFGVELPAEEVRGFVRWMESLRDKTTALLPGRLEAPAAEALEKVEILTESAVSAIIQPNP
ncbi:MAG: hypothetical protein E7632_05665 [Ruminococcaceae bacterium]|nr:hypothetical protein [Oscillospiraceae bacterium]